MRYRKVLGKNIRRRRKETGMSQEKLAGECNLHTTCIRSIERGERNISIDNVEKIAISLNIDIKGLFDESEEN